METKHLCVLIHIWTKGEVGTSGVEQPGGGTAFRWTEKSFSFQELQEAYPHMDWPKMQLCCMPQLTCFYYPVGFTFAFFDVQVHFNFKLCL